MSQAPPEQTVPSDGLSEIIRLYEEHGAGMYAGEPVTQLEHALQAAHFAELAGEPDAVVAAALLHDIGHLTHEFGEDCAREGIDDTHETAGAAWLAGQAGFGPAVTELIRLHVPAKRYLCSVDPSYAAQLSEASQLSLKLQGGVFSSEERQNFQAHEHFEAALRVRGYDDQAKQTGFSTPPLTHFLPFLARCLSRDNVSSSSN